jgi:D-glycero-D-manno-heptose 1,7-bisphosphate phosphatase
LDRDGVIVEDVDFVTEPDQLIVIPGAAEAIKILASRYCVIVVTNQSGIGRGYMTENDLLSVHTEFLIQLWREGAKLDGLYYCPHHPTMALGSYKIACDCRKPNPGMLRQAATRWGLDLESSFLVGDRDSDIEAAVAAGVRPILISEGPSRLNSGVTQAPDLLQAAHMIMNEAFESNQMPANTGQFAGSLAYNKNARREPSGAD